MKITIVSNENVPVPVYKNEGDAGFDLAIAYDEVLYPGEVGALKTGLAFNISKGYEMQIRPRSGISLNGCECSIYTKQGKYFAMKENIELEVKFGTVDSGYLGEVSIITKNCSDRKICIPRGTRLAQGIISKVEKAEFVRVEMFENNTQRGSDGFGSTGVK